MALSWALTDRLGRRLATIWDRKPGAEVVGSLNGQRTAQVEISVEDDAAKLVRPLATSLKVYDGNALIFFGPVLIPKFQAENQTITISAIDPSDRLVRQYLKNFPRQDQVEQNEIMAALVDAADATPAEKASGIPGHGIVRGMLLPDPATILHILDVTPPDPDTAPPPEVPPSYVPSTPQSPRWLFGQLFPSIFPPGWRFPQTQPIAPPSPGIFRDRSYPDGKQVWEALVEMSQVLDGPDFELEPVDADDGTYARLNAYYPRAGFDLTDFVRLEYNLGRHNASDFDYEPSGDTVVNRYTLSGQGTDGQPAPAWIAEQPESQRAFGILEEFDSATDITRTQTLKEHASEYVATHAWPIDFFDVTPSVEQGGVALGYYRDESDQLSPRQGQGFGLPPRFGPYADYWLGDDITALARVEPGLDLELVGRVTDFKMTEPDAAANPVCELTCAPLIVAAGVTGYSTTVSVSDSF